MILSGLILLTYFPNSFAQENSGTPSVTALIYHRFGEKNIPSTNVRLEQFEAHLDLIKAENISPVSARDLNDFLAGRTVLADKSTIVTIDDAYYSVLTEAWPRLKRAGIPLILFVATDAIDQNLTGYLTWNEIRVLVADGVEIGHHGAGHIHMIDEGLDEAQDDILRASARFEAELGFVPKYFAYPYGEYDRVLSGLIQNLGFDLAFAQYSGAIGPESDPYSLPRFAINERYGESSRFRDIIDARAWPLDRISPADTVISKADFTSGIEFMIEKPLPDMELIACYPSHQTEPAEIRKLENGIFRIELQTPFPRGRNRINCTLPAGDGRWYWWGWFFYVP